MNRQEYLSFVEYGLRDRTQRERAILIDAMWEGWARMEGKGTKLGEGIDLAEMRRLYPREPVGPLYLN